MAAAEAWPGTSWDHSGARAFVPSRRQRTRAGGALTDDKEYLEVKVAVYTRISLLLTYFTVCSRWFDPGVSGTATVKQQDPSPVLRLLPRAPLPYSDTVFEEEQKELEMLEAIDSFSGPSNSSAGDKARASAEHAAIRIDGLSALASGLMQRCRTLERGLTKSQVK